MTSQGQNDDLERAVNSDDRIVLQSASPQPETSEDTPALAQTEPQSPQAVADQPAAPSRPPRRGWVTRLLIAYFAIAALAAVGGAAWIYLVGMDFWPVLSVALGGFLLVLAVARWRKSWRVGLGAAALATVVIGGSYYWYIGRGPYDTKIAVRVTNPDGNPVSRANVILLHGGEVPVRQITDSNGIVNFTANSTLGDARLVVGARDFQAHEETINLSRNRDLTVNLSSLNEDIKTVLVRVVNKGDLRPIDKAEVQLFVGSEPYKEFTDINGLARFQVKFKSNPLDAELTVGSATSEVANQNIVLYPDQLQDIRIDEMSNEINVAPVQTVISSEPGIGSAASMYIPQQIAQKVDVFTDAPAIAEQEPNDTSASAQILATIGANHPIEAEINAFKDSDYFAFDAVAGQTYVVELYAVDSNLGLATNRYYCYDWYETFKGLRLAVYDTGDNRVATQCVQNAGGNNFAAARLKAAVTGRHVIEVAAHAETVVGKYRLRVMPKYDEKGAAWFENSLEPNNDPMNAFPIQPGLENTITSAIESRSSGYLSEQADVDWYTFNAQPGRTYVVELVEVEDLLSLGSNRYHCYGWYETFAGVGLAVLNPNLDLVQPSCAPAGAGDVHNIVEFTAQVGGPYYIQVLPQVATVSGIYSLRLLPKHDEPGAAYDAITLEPNNRQANAVPIDLDSGGHLLSAFEERTPGYSTNNPDNDWFFFPARAGATYVIDIVNVADSLKLGTNRYSCYGSYDNFSGVAIGVFNAAAEKQAAQCYPSGQGEVHTSVEFQALLNGNYYIQVFPHFGAGYGNYEIRVRTK